MARHHGISDGRTCLPSRQALETAIKLYQRLPETSEVPTVGVDLEGQRATTSEMPSKNFSAMKSTAKNGSFLYRRLGLLDGFLLPWLID